MGLSWGASLPRPAEPRRKAAFSPGQKGNIYFPLPASVVILEQYGKRGGSDAGQTERTRPAAGDAMDTAHIPE